MAKFEDEDYECDTARVVRVWYSGKDGCKVVVL